MKGMKTREMEKLLLDNNFVMVRSNGHKVFSNGKVQVALSHQKEVSNGVVRKIKTILRKQNEII